MLLLTCFPRLSHRPSPPPPRTHTHNKNGTHQSEARLQAIWTDPDVQALEARVNECIRYAAVREPHSPSWACLTSRDGELAVALPPIDKRFPTRTRDQAGPTATALGGPRPPHGCGRPHACTPLHTSSAVRIA